MSVNVPSLVIALGSVSIPQGDVVYAKVHLGGTKEVSSWELKLQNWNAKYSPSGAYPLNVGQNGYICIGRGEDIPQIITTRTEEVKFESNPLENYVIVSGRCHGEKLFRQVVTKKYSGDKGEAIVKNLIDNFAGLNHTRNSIELVENTSTTFTLLEYEDTPVWDILRYIAESSDNSGVIGYDFRVTPDGKFEFFPRGSKTSSVRLTDKIEESVYSKNIFGVRNRVTIYGVADKSYPLDKDALTESTTPVDGVWSAATGTIGASSNRMVGSYSIMLAYNAEYFSALILTLNSGKEVNGNEYPILNLSLVLEGSDLNGHGLIVLYDINNKQAWYKFESSTVNAYDGSWKNFNLKIGEKNAEAWSLINGTFDWAQIKKVGIAPVLGTNPGSANFYVDNLYFGGRRYSSMQEDPSFVEGFESLGDWTVGGTDASQQADTINFKQGTQSLKINSSSGNAAYSTKTVSWLLASEQSFGIWVYIYDLANLNGIALYLSSVSNFAKYFLAGISSSSLSSGWNHIILPKSAFTNSGGESWENTMVRLRVRVNPKASVNSSVSFDFLNSSDSLGESSQSAYGLRVLVDTDEELYSDNECILRAKAVLANKKDPAEYLTIKSTVIDYGSTPLLPGDKIHLALPNESVDADFRIISVDYEVDSKTQTLAVSLELGREVPLLADYMYRLRSKVDHVSRHKIAR